MFSTIDNRLIDLMQWLVWQCELFTKLTRKNIGVRLFSFSRIAMILYAAAMLLYGQSINSLIFAIILFQILGTGVLIALLQKNQLGLLAASQGKGMLPKEIIQRKIIRLAFLGAVVFNTLIILKTILPNFLNNFSVYCGLVSLILLNVVTLTLCAIEYLLCTTTLPPGEKERKKQERELSSMATQGSPG